MSADFQRVAIVNRGEPAMRVIHAIREFNLERGTGLSTIALFTDPDRRARFVREADESYHLGPATFVDDADGQRKPTYLDYARLEQALVAVQADAAWVGWGFVAERADFVELCDRLGVTFIGPTAQAIRRIGDKISAKRLAEQAGLRVTPWGGEAATTFDVAWVHAQRLGYPVVVKASAGRGRARHPPRLERGGTGDGVRRRAPRGGPFVRRLHGLRRALARGRASRRSPDARRPRGRAVGARRPRLHHPAAIPEADRRGAVAGAARRRGAGAQGSGHPPVPRRGLPGRRDGGVPVRPGHAPVLVHGGEPAPAGRTPGDRAHDRRGPGQAVPARRPWRPPRSRAAADDRPRDRGAAERRERGLGIRGRARRDRAVPAADRPRAARRYRRSRRGRHPARVRYDVREAVGRRPHAGGGPRAAEAGVGRERDRGEGRHDQSDLPAPVARSRRGACRAG